MSTRNSYSMLFWWFKLYLTLCPDSKWPRQPFWISYLVVWSTMLVCMNISIDIWVNGYEFNVFLYDLNFIWLRNCIKFHPSTILRRILLIVWPPRSRQGFHILYLFYHSKLHLTSKTLYNGQCRPFWIKIISYGLDYRLQCSIIMFVMSYLGGKGSFRDVHLMFQSPFDLFVVNISYRHKRPCNANTNFRDNRIWKLDHFQSARIVYYHLN